MLKSVRGWSFGASSANREFITNPIKYDFKFYYEQQVHVQFLRIQFS